MNMYVREYSWMWEQLKLSLAECRVYAYIYGLSHGEKGGYDGSKRHLAELLGLPKSTAFDAIDTLEEKHLIVYTGKLWQSVRQPDIESVRPAPECVRQTDENGRSPDSPHTPLYNNIDKNKASMQTDFEKFWKYFSPSAEYQNRRAATQMIFEARSDMARQAIIEAAQEGGGYHPGDNPNPYFFVQDFPEPQPHFLSGVEQDNCHAACIPLVQVRYNGAFKICTRDTMETFNLEWVRDW